MWAHLGALLLNIGGLVTCGISSLLLWLPPLVIYNSERGRDPFVRQHAKEALNFALTELVVSLLLLVPMMVVGVLVLLVALPIFIVAIIFRAMAATAANRGDWYRYPISIPFIR
ncbi:DUF4870 domain-containing protein [Sphaerimonospora cavernae]|uniref:DUF4870 domain-containing protein n=1 Tax=Sphaerimonospora cavernae TaxID=1740611 RepID=A0ABV6TXD0_9ACTN